MGLGRGHPPDRRDGAGRSGVHPAADPAARVHAPGRRRTTRRREHTAHGYAQLHPAAGGGAAAVAVPPAGGPARRLRGAHRLAHGRLGAAGRGADQPRGNRHRHRHPHDLLRAHRERPAPAPEPAARGQGRRMSTQAGPDTSTDAPFPEVPGGYPDRPRPAIEATFVPSGWVDRPSLGPRAAYAPRDPRIGFAKVITRVATAIALLSAWCVFFVVGLSSMETARDQQLLYAQLRSQLVLETVPIGGYIKPGTPIALIEIPAIKLRYVVVEGTSAGDLRAGPGHLRYTVLPGQVGVSVIYGRALAFGGPFQHITELQSGDAVTVTTQQGTFTYLVDRVRRAGDPIADPLTSGESRLRLVTAEGSGWRTGWASNQAVYVDAELQGTTQPTPSGRVSGVPDTEQALHGDRGALVPLLLWMQVLLALAGGAAWAQVRWGGAQTWLVAVPAILAALWGA